MPNVILFCLLRIYIRKNIDQTCVSNIENHKWCILKRFYLTEPYNHSNIRLVMLRPLNGGLSYDRWTKKIKPIHLWTIQNHYWQQTWIYPNTSLPNKKNMFGMSTVVLNRLNKVNTTHIFIRRLCSCFRTCFKTS